MRAGCWGGVVVEDLTVALLHLDECMLGVKGRDGDVSAVDNVQIARRERVDVPDGVEAAAFLFSSWPLGCLVAQSELLVGMKLKCHTETRRRRCREVLYVPPRNIAATVDEQM